MPTKTTKTGVSYDVTGKHMTWYPSDENGNRGDDGTLEPVRLPMRLKLRSVRQLSGDLEPAQMFSMLEGMIPGQAEVLDEMDLNDFLEMFSTWQEEYSALTGATLGE